MALWHCLSMLLPSPPFSRYPGSQGGKWALSATSFLFFPLSLVQQPFSAYLPHPNSNSDVQWFTEPFTLGPGRVNVALTLVVVSTTFFKIIYSFQDEALHWRFLTKQILTLIQKTMLATKIASLGIPMWLNGLRNWCCHCCGSSHCHVTGSIPDPGTFIYRGYSQKKPQPTNQTNKQQTNKQKHRISTEKGNWLGSKCCNYCSKITKMSINTFTNKIEILEEWGRSPRDFSARKWTCTHSARWAITERKDFSLSWISVVFSHLCSQSFISSINIFFFSFHTRLHTRLCSPLGIIHRLGVKIP